MKEFSSLNGYAVKDKTARDSINTINQDLRDSIDTINQCLSHLELLDNYETPQMHGAVADGITDDTVAIQATIDTGKDVYFPDGNYLVTGNGLIMNKENQKILFNGGAWIVAKNITSGYVLLVNSKFNKLDDIKIRINDTTETVNALQLGIGEGQGLIATANMTIGNFNATLPISCDVVYDLNTSIGNATAHFRVNNAALTKDWLRQSGCSVTIHPINGGSYTIGFEDDTQITTSENRTFTYSDLVTEFTTSLLKIKIDQNKNYLFVVKPGIVVSDNNCFTTYLTNVVTTGTGSCGLQVYAAEARVYNSKFRGTKYGIRVEAPDFYGENIYCEQCTSDGFWARSGSIEGHHIHSYNNKGKGFNLSGVNYSNFYGLYADKNIGDGVYITDNSGEINIFGGWSFYSGYKRTDKAVFDWNFSNVKDLNLWGCRSNGGDETKVASYNIQENCRIYLYNCMANIAPQIKDGAVAKFLNCQDRLKKYNTAPNAYNGTRQVVDAGAVSKVTVYLDEILNEEKDIMVFDTIAQFRSVLGYTSGMTRHLLQLSEAYEDKFAPIVESEKITVSSPSVTFVENGATVVEFNIMNNTEEQLQVNVTLNKVGSVY